MPDLRRRSCDRMSASCCCSHWLRVAAVVAAHADGMPGSEFVIPVASTLEDPAERTRVTPAWTTGSRCSRSRITRRRWCRSRCGCASGRVTSRVTPDLAHLFEHMMFKGSKYIARGRARSARSSARRPAERIHEPRLHGLLRGRAARVAAARDRSRGRTPREPRHQRARRSPASARWCSKSAGCEPRTAPKAAPSNR